MDLRHERVNESIGQWVNSKFSAVDSKHSWKVIIFFPDFQYSITIILVTFVLKKGAIYPKEVFHI